MFREKEKTGLSWMGGSGKEATGIREKEKNGKKRLAAGQPVCAHSTQGAVGPELDELLDVEDAGQILAGPAIGGMAAHPVRQDVSRLPGDMGLSLHIRAHPDLQGGIARG